MTLIMKRRSTLFLVACVLVVALTACGKRGDLMRPGVSHIPNAGGQHAEAVHYG